MTHPPPARREDLPLSLLDLVETIDEFHGAGAGLRVALRLMQAFGGRDLKFPQNPGPDHPVVDALGEADAGVLCGLLGGQQIYIPHGRRPRNQRAAVLDMERQGRTRAQIAAALGLSERHVRWLANRRPQADPLPLFPDEN